MEERGEYDARYFTLPCINSTNVDQIQEYQSNACVEEEFGTGCVKSAPSRKKNQTSQLFCFYSVSHIEHDELWRIAYHALR